MANSEGHRLFTAGGRVRSGWRIVLFIALFIPFALIADWLASGLGTADFAGPLFRSGAVTLVAALGAGWLLLAWLDRRPLGALGFALTGHTPRELVGGLAIAGTSLALVVGALALAGMVRYRPEPGTLGGFAAVLVGDLLVLAVAAAAEEALFRGYPFQALVEGVGAAGATVLASGAFALAHAGNPNVGAFALINIFLAGVLLSVAYLRTRSLWFATSVHLGWNWTMASLLDLPVSGLEFFDTPLYEPVTVGPAWVTGGAFGPEGGVAATVASALALVALVKIPGFGEAVEMRGLRGVGRGRGQGEGRGHGHGHV